MIARHALFSFGSRMSVCEDLAHIGATYYAIDLHMTSAVVLIVLVFVLHFERNIFFKRLLLVATFILVLCICCL